MSEHPSLGMSETEMITLPFTQMAIRRGLLFVAKLPYAETTKSRPDDRPPCR